MIFAPDLPPGLYRNGTTYEARGRYVDADLIRWHEGAKRPIGGWRERADDPVTGKARAVLTWRDNSNSSWAAIGTHSKLYAMTRGGTLHDITPSGFTPGRESALVAGGYGTGAYGTGIYGAPRPDTTNIIPAMVWSLDTWGQNLVACADDTIYEWDLNTSNDAVAITNAPSAEAVVVTEERIMMALGSDGDPRAVDWSDAEDNTDWTPSATNLAGGKRVQTVGKLLAGKRVRGGVLLFTDVDVHRASYVGLPLVYAFDRLSTGCGLISKGSVVATDARTFWMGLDSFWQYDGAVTPLNCEIADDLFANLNQLQGSKVSGFHVSAFGEIWWLYPSGTSVECDRYIAYNYRDDHWTRGALARTCGADRGVFNYPLMIGDDGTIYDHEVGQQRDGRQPFLTTAPLELGDGDTTMEVHGYVPDEQHLGDVQVSFTVGDWTLSDDSTFGPYDATAKTDLRFSGRRVAITYEADADKDFRIGRPRFMVKTGSPR